MPRGRREPESSRRRSSCGRRGGRREVSSAPPEDIDDLARAQQNGHLPVDAVVEVVEFLGNELQLQLSASKSIFVARVSTDTQTRPGEKLRVGFNLKKLHVFDKATGMALR